MNVSLPCCCPIPATDGAVHDHRRRSELAHQHGALVIADADLLALTMLPSPASWGADICVGVAQRFGTPLGLWWSSCWLHCRERSPQAQITRPHRWRVARPSW